MSTLAEKSGIYNYTKVVKELDKALKDAPRTYMERALSDVKSRGPGWIAEGVTKRYNIKRKEITSGKVGKLNVTGKGIKSVQFEYRGRGLTPVHFGMSPKSPKEGGSYTLKASILKGERITIGKVKKLTKKQRAALGKNFRREGTRNSPKSPFMLQHTGNQKENGVNYIPFQRTRQPGNLEKKFVAVSLPQMVTEGKNGPMHPEVAKNFDEKLEKRLSHHMKLLEK